MLTASRSLLLIVLAAVALGACGTAQSPPAANAPALALSSRTPDEVPVTPRQLRAPIARYRRWVAAQLRATSAAVDAMRGAVASGDLAAARTHWARATYAYGAIGAAYGAFGVYDSAIDGSPDGLRRNDRDPRFTGLHRVELALWRRASIRDARAPARRLARDVGALRARIGRIRIDPAEYVLRAHEVLEDALDLDLTGHSARYSGHAVDAIAGRVRGARVVLATLDPLLGARDPSTRQQSTLALDRLARGLRGLRHSDGTYPALDALARRPRARLAGLVAGAAQALAPVPESLDLRPAAPLRAPITG
jgi:iron uptake system EfeUOB component EfeO/EfeM